MPYARTNWTFDEVLRITQNPVDISGDPHAHSKIHATDSELANHPMFQRARVLMEVTEIVRNRLKTKVEVGVHTTLKNTDMARALVRVLNHERMQSHLARLDQHTGDVKVWINFIRPIGIGMYHNAAASVPINIKCLFLYMKANPGNKDLMIFQTLVPHENHKPFGSVTEPIIIVS
jgi:hypothetical protein